MLPSKFMKRRPRIKPKNSPWNSLEFAKLLVAPVVAAILAFVVQAQLATQSSTTQNLLAVQTRMWQQNRKLVERRLQVYDSINFQLNRIYCFIEDVGKWKEDDPEKVIGYKRHIDQIMHTQRALWSPDTFQAYLDYINKAAFKTYTGIAQDAKIRTATDQKRALAKYDRSWERMIEEPKDSHHQEAYNHLMTLLARDMQWPGEANH